MRLSDMCLLPLAALWQQKVRTALTTMGVVFGSFVLTASLSTNQGVQDAIAREMGDREVLRRIQVQPRGNAAGSQPIEVKGRMSEAQRARIRDATRERQAWEGGATQEKVVTREKLRELGTLEHVEKVVPAPWQFGMATVDGQTQDATAFGVLPDSKYHRQRLIAGQFFDGPSANSAVMSEFLAYRMGFVDESAIKNLVGKTVHFEMHGISGRANRTGSRRRGGADASALRGAALGSLMRQAAATLSRLGITSSRFPLANLISDGDTLTRDFKIIGIFRLPTKEEKDLRWDALNQEANLLLPIRTATDMFFAVPRQAEQGISATVIVDDDAHVDSVLERIKDMQLNAFAFREGLKRERLLYSLIFRSMTCIAAVALFVAALGIANTMLMSVLERTREIGVMKAVGAGNGQLQLIFLIEGTLIGLGGGGAGLLLAWGASYPGDLWVRSMVSRDIKVDLKSSLFVFPPWLLLTVVIFAVLVTTLAAVYPARRAAKIDAVAALRHE
jgi:putative ABC transport system permease protein